MYIAKWKKFHRIRKKERKALEEFKTHVFVKIYKKRKIVPNFPISTFCLINPSEGRYLFHIQLRGNQKDVNFQLQHRLSKSEVPVVANLKHIFELFGLYTTCFLIQKLLESIRSSSDGQFWRKSQNKIGGKFDIRSWLCQ